MRRLLCEKTFGQIISDISNMSMEKSNKYLAGIKMKDLEIKNKLVLLGITEEKIATEMNYLIDQKIEPTFIQLAIPCKTGKKSFILI